MEMGSSTWRRVAKATRSYRRKWGALHGDGWQRQQGAIDGNGEQYMAMGGNGNKEL
jgi:hypothetical protein